MKGEGKKKEARRKTRSMLRHWYLVNIHVTVFDYWQLELVVSLPPFASRFQFAAHPRLDTAHYDLHYRSDATTLCKPLYCAISRS